MGELLFRTGDLLLSTAIRRMLTGAGLTLASAGVSVAVVESLIERIESELSSLPHLAIALMNLSATDTAVSLVLSAMLSRTVVNNAHLYLTRA